MANRKSKILEFFGFGGADDYDEESDYFDEEETETPARKRRSYDYEEEEPRRSFRKTRIVPVQERSAQKTNSVVIYSPKAYNDALALVTELIRHKHVIIKLDRVDKRIGQRILDFMSGAAYASDAQVTEVSKGCIYLFASNQTQIDKSDDYESDNTDDGYTLDDEF